MNKLSSENYTEQMKRLFFQDEYSEAKYVTFQVTDDCNLRCSYCYQINKQHNYMSFDTAKKFIDNILFSTSRDHINYLKLDDIKIIVIDFIGGEPLLNIEVIEQITEYFINKLIELDHRWLTRFRISICSNGVAYFDQKVQDYLKKYNDVVSYTVSIDGNKELHDSCRVFEDGSGSYDMAITAYKHYKKEYRKKFLDTKMTLSPYNIIYTSKAVIDLINTGIEIIYCNTIFEEGWNLEHAKIFYNELKKIADYVLDNNLENNIFISLFNEESFYPMDPLQNQNWCFRGDTMVSTPYGHQQITQLQEGDIVYSNSLTPQRISKVFSRIAEDTISIQATGAFKTYTTKDHPFLVRQLSHRGNNKYMHYFGPSWIAAKDIKIGDKIALSVHNFGNINIDKRLAYIVGRYIGDGWHSTTGYKICSNYKECEGMKLSLDAAGINYSIVNRRTIVQFNIFLNNIELINILSQCGIGAYTKKLPACSYQWDKESVIAMLRGLYDADGSFSSRSFMYKFNTVSPTLAQDVLLMIRSIGYFPTCYFNQRAGTHIIEGRTVNVRDRYEIYYGTEPLHSRYCDYDRINNVIWTTVQEINNEQPYEVYNLTVENENTFIANGILVHNCGGTGSMIAVDYKGDIYPCLRYHESSIPDNPLIIGNVEDGIALNDCEKNKINCLTCITRRSQSTDECFNCSIADGCAWCSALNHQLYGTADKRATFICAMHKARSLANVYYWNSLYKKNEDTDKIFKRYLNDEESLNIIDVNELEILNKLERRNNNG